MNGYQLLQLVGNVHNALLDTVEQGQLLVQNPASTSNFPWLTTVKRSGSDIEPKVQKNVGYHSWGPEGVEFDPILDLINNLYYKPDPGWTAKLYGPFVGFVAMHNGSRPALWFAKIVLRRRHSVDTTQNRLGVLLPNFQRALRVLLFDDPGRFAALFDVLKQVGSLPVIMDLSDFLGCNKDNYNMSLEGNFTMKSVPFLTMCRHVECQYAFPIPGFEDYQLASIPEEKIYGNSSSWDPIFAKWAETYPAMEDKIPKAFWRGSCTKYRPHRRQM